MPRLTPRQHVLKTLEKQRMAIMGRIEQLKIQLANVDKMIAETQQQRGA